MSRPSKRTLVHVNMHVAAANARTGRTDPCLTVKTHNTNTYAHEALVADAAGVGVLKVVHRPEAPLPGGGMIWIEVYGRVEARSAGDGQPEAAETLTGRRAAPVIIRVSRPTIRANAARAAAPVLTLRAAGREVTAHEAVVYGPAGESVAEIVYRPDQPLSCGARLWVQTRAMVTPWVRPDRAA